MVGPVLSMMPGLSLATGIHSFNPDKVLAEIEKKKNAKQLLAPRPTSTPQLFKFLNAPQNRWELQQQTMAPISALEAGRRNLLSSYCEGWYTVLMLLGHRQNWPIMRMKTLIFAILARRD